MDEFITCWPFKLESSFDQLEKRYTISQINDATGTVIFYGNNATTSRRFARDVQEIILDIIFLKHWIVCAYLTNLLIIIYSALCCNYTQIVILIILCFFFFL